MTTQQLLQVSLHSPLIPQTPSNPSPQLDCHTILGNTYHLGQRPTTPLIDQMGGLHNFMQVRAAPALVCYRFWFRFRYRFWFRFRCRFPSHALRSGLEGC